MSRKSMKLRTLYLPPRWTQLLAELVREGYYGSVSHAIRAATRDLLQFHGKNVEATCMGETSKKCARQLHEIWSFHVKIAAGASS